MAEQINCDTHRNKEEQDNEIDEDSTQLLTPRWREIPQGYVFESSDRSNSAAFSGNSVLRYTSLKL